MTAAEANAGAQGALEGAGEPPSELREAFDLVSDAIYCVDADWRLTYMNRAAERAIGAASGEFLGRDLWRLYPEAVGGELWRAHQEVMRSRQPLSVRAVSRAVGRRVEGTLRATADGGLLVVLRDVEEQQRTNTRLAQSEWELSSVLEAVRDGFCAIDAEGRITLFNRVAEAFFGLDRSSVLGRPIWAVLPGAGSEIERQLARVASTGEPVTFRTPSVARPGRTVEISASPWGGGGLAITFRDVTEAARAEAALAASEQMLRSVTDAMPVLISLIDRDERFQFANKAYEQRFGRPLSEIVGARLEEVFDPQTYAARRSYIRRALDGERVSYEVRFHHPTDGWMDTLVEHIPNCGADGQVQGFYVLVQDLTAVRRAETALRESEERLELATQASALGVWEWRLESDALILSPRARAIWGFSAEDGVSLDTLLERTHPDDRAAFSAQLGSAFDPPVRPARPDPFRIVHPDGAVRWVTAYGAPIVEDSPAGPHAVRYVGAMQDITEAQDLQDALARSAGRLRLAVEAGRMAVWAIDAAGQLEASPELNRMLGLPADARPTLAAVQAQYYPGELERLQRLAAETLGRGERYLEAEYRHIRANDGAVRWLLVRAEFLFDPAGRTAGSIGVVLDITARKEAEDRLLLLAKEVDHRANNLLTIVQGAITLTRAASLEDYRQALLGRVAALARAHQLLAASRWTQADLRRIVEDELRAYGGESDAIGVEGPPVGLTPARAQSVALAIHELATNAMKHGALGRPGGRLRVEWRTAPGGGEVVLVWRESGCFGVVAPVRRGVGMQVLERALAGSGEGRAVLDWRDDGLQCTLIFTVGSEPEAV